MKRKKTFVSRLCANIKLMREVHQSWKNGADAIRLEPVWSIPCVRSAPAYLNTIEGCQTWKLGRDTDRAVKAVSDGLPYEMRSARAQFWKEQLKPVFPQEMYHKVMLTFIHWYARCLRDRLRGHSTGNSAEG